MEARGTYDLEQMEGPLFLQMERGQKWRLSFHNSLDCAGAGVAAGGGAVDCTTDEING